MAQKRCYRKRIGVMSALTLLLLAGSATAQEQKTLVNQEYGFQVSYPADWKVQRVLHPDPFPKIEDFKAGRAKLSGVIQIGSDAPEPADWNAAYFNQGLLRAMGDPPALPTILVYVHPAAAMSFDEFTAYLKWLVGTTGMELVSSAKAKTASGLEGYDYVYHFTGGMLPTRLVVFFKDGKRYGLTYPEMEQKDFDRFAQSFGELVRSFQILASTSGAGR